MKTIGVLRVLGEQQAGLQRATLAGCWGFWRGNLWGTKNHPEFDRVCACQVIDNCRCFRQIEATKELFRHLRTLTDDTSLSEIDVVYGKPYGGVANSPTNRRVTSCIIWSI